MTSSILVANNPMLDVRDLHVDFINGDAVTHAVRGVSFQLGREKLAIVGESGSGKSTVGRALLRLHPAKAQIRAARMQFGDVDLQAVSEAQMRGIRGKRISMIMQDPKYSLNPVVCVGDQIAEAWLTHHPGRKAEAKAKVLEMLDVVRIRQPERVYHLCPHEISGGQGQRIMIAMMLIADPELVIADEPTSALDVSVQAEILNLLAELQRESNLTYLMVTHDLGVIAHLCQKVAVMQYGKILESLTVDELVAGQAKTDYTRMLVNASQQYSREMAREVAVY